MSNFILWLLIIANRNSNSRFHIKQLSDSFPESLEITVFTVTNQFVPLIYFLILRQIVFHMKLCQGDPQTIGYFIRTFQPDKF